MHIIPRTGTDQLGDNIYAELEKFDERFLQTLAEIGSVKHEIANDAKKYRDLLAMNLTEDIWAEQRDERP